MAAMIPRRSAFTLTELLIVIAIIALLAGMLFPAMNMIRAQANEVKCESNMRNIAMAIEVYRQDHDQAFPGSFCDLVTLYSMTPKVCLCPLDTSIGTDKYMGRNPAWTSGSFDFTSLYYAAEGSTTYTHETAPPAPKQLVHTSYDFEANGIDDATVCPQEQISFFYDNLPHSVPPQPAEGTVSWADCKLNEQANGNWDVATHAYDLPFPTATVPILRCYHHWDWLKATMIAQTASDHAMSYPSKVVNINLDFGVIKTIPWWEVGYNPATPHN